MEDVGREGDNERPCSVISISAAITFAVRGSSQLFCDKLGRRDERYTASKYAAGLMELGNVPYSLPRVLHLFLPEWLKLRVLLRSAQ